MNIGMNFIVGLTLIVSQSDLIRALDLDLDHQCKNPLFFNYHLDEYPTLFQMISGVNNLRLSWFDLTDREIDILENLKIFAENILADDLNQALLTNDYKAVRDMSDQIYAKQPKMFRSLLKRAIKTSFDNISMSNFLKFFNCHKHAVQSAHGYSAMIEEFERRNKLNSSIAITLAFNFKKAYDRVCSTSSPSQECSEISSLPKLLPSSLKNLVFEKELCIQSKATGQFLYAADEPTTWSRRIKTVEKADLEPLRNISWVVEPYKDALHIKSFDSNEYIRVVADYYDSGKDRAKVELKTLSHDFGYYDFNHHSEWIFEPSGDGDVLISNPGSLVYLFQEHKDIKDKDYVFASRSKFNESLWKIYAC